MKDALLSRNEFRNLCLDRDNGTCLVPWCDSDADEVHHVIERSEWSDGGYYMRNGASVCNLHHRYAESNYIPPHAFWNWMAEGGVDPLTPDGYDAYINKWGDDFDAPPWKEHREYIKYQSTRHLPFSHRGDQDDTFFREVDSFLEVPLVVTMKMDGGNCTLVADQDEPVRARNGSHAEHQSFDMAKQMYWENNLYEVIPEHLQMVGEWLYAKHSIHYGCDCEEACEDVGPELDAYFQLFGVYDTRYDMWLGWPSVEQWADRMGVETVPVIRRSTDDSEPMFERDHELYDDLTQLSGEVVSDGHEGFVIRSKFPFHYSQFGERLGKFVREDHVREDEEHWSKRRVVPNVVSE